MIQLNQQKTSTLTRTFDYDLPAFLAKGKTCFFKVTALSHDECTIKMRPAYELLMNTLQSRQLFLNKRLEREDTSTGKQDMDNNRAVAPFSRFQKDGTIAQQRFLRELTMACFDTCIESWECNIFDNATGETVISSRENFEALATMAYPDKSVPDSTDLNTLFNDMRRDVLDLEGLETEASDEVQEAQEKN